MTVVDTAPLAATPASAGDRGAPWARLRPIAAVAVASAAAFAVLVAVFTDVGVLAALDASWRGAFGSVDAVSETLTRAIPLALVGVGAAVALRAGVFNVGGEGQMAMGAVLAAIAIMPIDTGPPVLVWLVGLLAGAVGGAAWVAVPAVLWVGRGVSEILSTLLMNFIAVALLAWLLANTFLADPDPVVITPQGGALPDDLRFPLLVDGSRLHLGLLVAVGVVAVAAVAMRARTGLRLDLVGASPSLAAQAGLRPRRARLTVLGCSAAVAGLAGAVQLFGLSHRLTTGLTAGVGYTGLLVAVLGRGRPIATAVAALVFAALVTGGEALEREGVPRTLSAVIQAVLIIGAALAMGATATRRSR